MPTAISLLRPRWPGCGRGSVLTMTEMIGTVFATVGWAAGLAVLLTMAALPLLEHLGCGRAGERTRRGGVR